ncbi:GNAT family N-acetyltransferase [Williamsia deligens]|uniref:GNAT family N-acetyltransferase n=1 Tax=Williamsia deligens TaxID=321325 RepID=A0ABW3G8H7_9NOCA|nr:GNAT family N-acetyltransferase [Williamsia deligens]MCP2192464.1 phosphinothricin acetyltransferase [Williamsia deligens]
MSIEIRPAHLDDVEQIAQIYTHYVETTVITFDYTSPSVDEWRSRLTAITGRGRPFLVAADTDDPGTVLGYAYLGDFRTKTAYDWTTEDSIYLRPEATGRGLGSALLRALLTDLDPATVRRVVAVISVIESDASIRLHERFGFERTGTLRRIGWKFDRWIDCAVLQYEVPGT